MQFIPFTEEEKQQANQTDLVSFLQMRGEILKPVGKEYKLIYHDESGKHDSITISGSKWFDHKNQIGGGAVKFMQIFYEMNFPQAVQELLGYTVMPEYSGFHENCRRSPPKQAVPEPKKEFHLPERNQNMHRVYAYLIQKRFIAPEIVSYFAKNRTLYEDAQYHNVVFVGLDENGVPRQAHKRSANTFRNFRMTCEGSDTRYSFSHFGQSDKLYVFEAPIDMLSFLTLYPKNWQEHSYIAMNGVYENALLRALETHQNLQKIVLCVDHDEGGIDAIYRLTDILHERGYQKISCIQPNLKDWNEVLKAMHGEPALPAVPHKRLQIYHDVVSNLQENGLSPGNLQSLLTEYYQKKEYQNLAESALTGSAFFLQKAGYSAGFLQLCKKMTNAYRPHTDKGSSSFKQKNVGDHLRQVMPMLHQGTCSKEFDVTIAKKLYELAESAVRMCTEEAMAESVQEEPEQNSTPVYYI